MAESEQAGLSVVSFEEKTLKINDYHLFDLGVADVDGNGFLDIFTSNHNFRQSLLLNDGTGLFRDVFYEWGLAQSKGFPMIEDSHVSTASDAQGVHIYWHNRTLVIKVNRAALSATVKLSSKVEILSREGIEVSVVEEPIGEMLTKSMIKLGKSVSGPDGLVVLKPFYIGLPVSVELDKDMALDSVFVGGGKINPKTHDFSIFLKDRHGMAWADFTGDGQIDVFIVRGGLRGDMGMFPEKYSDEMFVRETGDVFKLTETTGIEKNACRARQVAWVDYNNDGMLDLFYNCFRSSVELWEQASPGVFRKATAKAGLYGMEDGQFVWFDFDMDGWQDVLVAGPLFIKLYMNRDGRFIARNIFSYTKGIKSKKLQRKIKNERRSNKITVADYDLDGDLDAYVASPYNSLLLVNEKGRLSPVKPSSAGLPDSAVVASWADVDNDGLPDLHAVPTGLYLQRKEGGFQATGQLAFGSLKNKFRASASWFDLENDGDRDLIVSYPDVHEGADKFKNATRFYMNKGSTNHWLEVELRGSGNNPQALGAKVALDLPDGERHLQQVGVSEGSHYSQGHYRLYFGLGVHKKVSSIDIIWPDGTRQELKNVRADQLIEIIQK
ncbi:MAG: CRTAC1 family protein [Thermodesulfovibrionales bacterium]|nr:CRTAC1 family protein [Thermodesulfovibrionales bacterium]